MKVDLNVDDFIMLYNKLGKMDFGEDELAEIYYWLSDKMDGWELSKIIYFIDNNLAKYDVEEAVEVFEYDSEEEMYEDMRTGKLNAILTEGYGYIIYSRVKI